MHAEIVRLSLHHVDIKIVSGDRMHVLQWRRNLLWDEVLLDGDPGVGYSSWTTSEQRLKGVHLEGKDGPLVSYGTLDPKSLEKPATFSDWMKKTMGIDWGMGSDRPN